MHASMSLRLNVNAPQRGACQCLTGMPTSVTSHACRTLCSTAETWWPCQSLRAHKKAYSTRLVATRSSWHVEPTAADGARDHHWSRRSLLLGAASIGGMSAVQEVHADIDQVVSFMLPGSVQQRQHMEVVWACPPFAAGLASGS
jgi:hypothetical protein